MDMVCPVCKKKAENQKGVLCPKCGFKYAFVPFFGNEKSLDYWRTEASRASERLNAKRRQRFSEADCLVLSNDEVAYVSEDAGRLITIEGTGSVDEVEHVKQYCRSERNRAFLFDDGTVEVRGDNTYRQCETGELTDVAFVLCGSKCTYTIGNDGIVSMSGAILNHEISEWESIKALACGSFHLLGLTANGKVKIAGDLLVEAITEKVSGWRNVREICAASDCSIALFEDGTLAFAGRDNDPRKGVENWTDIVSVKADNSFAYGLTNEGNILISGSCSSFLDMGRTKVTEWKDVIAIACSKSGIAAILGDGSLRIAGILSGDTGAMCKKWEEYIEV